MAKFTAPPGKPRRVQVQRQPNGHARITIDGHDISNLVTDWQVHSGHLAMTTVTVTLADVAVDINTTRDTIPEEA